MERVKDPNFQASVRGYVSEAQRRAQVAGQSANEWSKTQLGVDVADQMGGMMGAVRDTLGSGPRGLGYDSLSMHNEAAETSGRYHDDTDDLFHECIDSVPSAPEVSPPAPQPSITPATKDDDWDDWKAF